MARSSTSFSSCSLLMAFLFAYSASVQFDDQDWYFWIPLYACASVVNLINNTLTSITIRRFAKITFWLGAFLFAKVVTEDYLGGLAGFWSLDLEKRVVREKMGSGLVVISMLLQLEASSPPNDDDVDSKALDVPLPLYVEYGMAALVGISYGFFLVFFVFVKADME